MTTVLIVDDDPGFRRLAQGIVHGDGTEAGSMREGLEQAKKMRPTLIILDSRFRGIYATGVDMIPAFREAAPDAEIVVVSELDNYHDSERAVRLGAFAYVPKVNRETLRTVILAALLPARPSAVDPDPSSTLH